MVAPWQGLIDVAVELDRRRQHGFPLPADLSWLEAEAVMVLEEEKTRLLREGLPGAAPAGKGARSTGAPQGGKA